MKGQERLNTTNNDVEVQQKGKHVHILLRAVGITLLAFLLSFVLSSPITLSLSSLFYSSDQEDRNISDFYSQVANHRPIRHHDPEIVIIDIENAGRDEIAELMETLALCDPKAVGLDVMFCDEREGDGRLIAALQSVPNLVMPVLADLTASEIGGGKIKDSTYFSGSIRHTDGIVNLVSKQKKGIIREFPTWFSVGEKDSVPSFAVAIATTAHPESKRELSERGNKIEIIDYPSHEFTVIPITDVSERSDELLNKIVLAGAMKDMDDVHSTPINSMMPGVLIHAYSVSTVTSGRYYSKPGLLADWLLAFVLSLFTIWVSIIIDSRVKGLFIRILQLIIVYLSVQICYYLFIEGRIIINITYTLLMMTFGIFASDIWHGTKGTLEMIKEKINKR